mmetsp:Transcript_37153/g.61596  ORF Transcript_37153/g.61596 Transcript_37153/m.61596 type:complete len:730 (+) Transcript_37153:330-2519(+)
MPKHVQAIDCESVPAGSRMGSPTEEHHVDVATVYKLNAVFPVCDVPDKEMEIPTVEKRHRRSVSVDEPTAGAEKDSSEADAERTDNKSAIRPSRSGAWHAMRESFSKVSVSFKVPRIKKLLVKHKATINDMAKELFVAENGTFYGPDGVALTDDEAYRAHLHAKANQSTTPGALRAAAAALVFAIRIQSTTFVTLRKSGYTLRNLNTSAFVLAFFGIICMLLENEIYHNTEMPFLTLGYQRELASNCIRSAMSLTSILLVIVIHRSYQVRIIMLRMNVLLDGVTLWSSDLFWPCVTECCICIIHVPPFVNMPFILHQTGLIKESEVPYDIHLFGLLMFLRIYLFGRWVKDHSQMFQASARLLTALNKVDLTFGFVMKTVFRRHPLRSLFCIISANLLISSYCLYMTDRVANPDLNFFDAVWLLFIAMATVGFGDLVPLTYPGRLVIVVCVLVGLVTTALLVAIVHDRLTLSDFEWRIYHILQTGSARKEVRQYAARTIQVFWRRKERSVEHYRMLQRWRQARRALQAIEKEVAFGPTLFEIKNAITGLTTSIENDTAHRRDKLNMNVRQMSRCEEPPVELDLKQFDSTYDVRKRLSQSNLLQPVNYQDERSGGSSSGSEEAEEEEVQEVKGTDVSIGNCRRLSSLSFTASATCGDSYRRMEKSVKSLSNRVANMESKLDTLIGMMSKGEKKMRARTVYNLMIDTQTESAELPSPIKPGTMPDAESSPCA